MPTRHDWSRCSRGTRLAVWLTLATSIGCTAAIEGEGTLSGSPAGGAAGAGGALIGGTSTSTGAGVGAGAASGAGGGTVVTTADGCDIAVPAPRIWRLTPAQYKASVNAALGIADIEVSDAPGDSVDVRTGFANSAEKTYIGDRLAVVLTTQSERAAAVYADRAELDYPCLGEASASAGCAGTFVSELGFKILRRPLTAEESERYGALFDSRAKAATTKSAIRATTAALLMSPSFLYRFELGDALPPGRLAQYEIASALSYTLTDGPPSGAVLAAAAAGTLTDPVERTRLARELVGTKAASDKLGDFMYWQLQFYKLEAKRAELGTDVVSGLVAENKAFVGFVLGGPQRDLHTLFTSDVAFPSAATSAIYGVEQPAKEPTLLKMPAGERFGIFTQPGWLSATQGPMHRGKVIKNLFLCEKIDPPAGVDPAELKKQLPVLPEDATEQEAWAAFQANNPGCAACHRQFHPLGLALENYDSLGRFRRATETGKAIDPSGEVLGADGWSGRFSGAGDLIEQIAASDKGKYCFSERYLSYVSGGPVKGDNPSCVAKRIAKVFDAAGTDLRELMVATVGDESFVTR